MNDAGTRATSLFQDRRTLDDSQYNNFLLRRLDEEVLARLHLHPVDLPLRREIEYPGKPIENLFFLEQGMASMTTTFADGFQVEVALAGTEAVLGASCLMGTKRSLNRVYMQAAGHGFTCKAATAREEFKRGGKFQKLTLRYLQAQFIQSAQTAGCNAHHSVEQRLARWLLLCCDRLGGTNIRLSQEYMADMIGARRSTVTITAISLKAKNLITYSRGNIEVLDKTGLESAACECYRVVRDHLADYTEYDSGLGA